MVYAKQVWNDGKAGGTPITAARLNVIENGLDGAHNLISALPTTDAVTVIVDDAIEEFATNQAVYDGGGPEPTPITATIDGGGF